MADISDVLGVLVDQAVAAVYPNGTASPSVSGADIIVYPGWPPSSDDLDKDLEAGKTHVSVFPKQEERNTTRYPERYLITVPPAPTLNISYQMYDPGQELQQESGDPIQLEDLSGNILLESSPMGVTIGGAVSVPHNVMLRVNNKQYVYAVQPNDTLNLIAANLAALVAVDISGTTSSGPTVLMGSSGRVQAARVGTSGTVAKEIRRQERLITLTVWSGWPQIRDTVAAAIDVALADQRFISMPDGFGARLIYKNSVEVDALQKATLYRRDLNYTVEFATTSVQQAQQVIAPLANISVDGSAPAFLGLEGGGQLTQEDGSAILLDDGTTPVSITV
jgi:hypothetical protein